MSGEIACSAVGAVLSRTFPRASRTSRRKYGVGRRPPLANVAYATHISNGVTPEEPRAIERFLAIGEAMPRAFAVLRAESTPTSFRSRMVARLRDLARASISGIGPKNVPS